MKENQSNGLEDIISQAIEEMKSEQGNNFSLEKINLAELERRTGISRAKLRGSRRMALYSNPRTGRTQGSSDDSDWLYCHSG